MGNSYSRAIKISVQQFSLLSDQTEETANASEVEVDNSRISMEDEIKGQEVGFPWLREPILCNNVK